MWYLKLSSLLLEVLNSSLESGLCKKEKALYYLLNSKSFKWGQTHLGHITGDGSPWPAFCNSMHLLLPLIKVTKIISRTMGKISLLPKTYIFSFFSSHLFYWLASKWLANSRFYIACALNMCSAIVLDIFYLLIYFTLWRSSIITL